MEEKNKLYLRWGRLTAFVFLCLIDIAALTVLRSYFLLMSILVLGFFAAFDLYEFHIIGRGMKKDIRLSQNSIKKGQETEICVVIHQMGGFPILNCRVALEIDNTFLDRNSEMMVSMPVRSRAESVFHLPIKIDALGRVVVTAGPIRLRDALGIFETEISGQVFEEIVVMPEDGEEYTEDISSYLGAMSEVEESHEKGNDYSEVSDIREYIPGDKLRDIHWKLSAKQDSWMVKERVSMSGSRMMLVVEMTEDQREAEQALEKTYHVVQAIIKRNISVGLLIWNGRDHQFDEYICNEKNDLMKALADVYRIPALMRVEEHLVQRLKNLYPFMETYLCITRDHTQLQVVMRKNV